MKTQANSSIKRTLVLAVALLIVVAGTVSGLEAMHVTHFFHRVPDPEKTKTETKGGGSSFSGKGEATTTPGTSGSNSTAAPSLPHAKTDGNNEETAVLLAPTGTFASAHKGVSLSTALTSVCNTTPGAKCEIIFTSGSTQHSLYAQTADSNGAVYWDRWTPTSIGLTPGTWKIEAKATLGSQSQSTEDALTLEVNS